MLLVQLKKYKKHLHKIFYRTNTIWSWRIYNGFYRNTPHEITIVPTKNWVLDDRIKLYQIGSNHLVSKPKTEKNSTMASDSGNHAWWKTFFSSS